MTEMSVLSLSKGQTFMPDFMASLTIFAVLVAVFLSSWNSIVSNNPTGSEMLQTRHTSTFLIATEGYPDNWEEENVEPEIPGFAERDHVLSREKLREFRELSYERQKDLLQAPEYYMELRNESTVFELDGAEIRFGRDHANASQIYPVRRSVLYNKSGELVDAELVYVTWE